MRPRLRLFTGEEEANVSGGQWSIRLRDLHRALSDAGQYDRSWLCDFEDDEVQVSSDLYEVLAAYLHMRPGA